LGGFLQDLDIDSGRVRLMGATLTKKHCKNKTMLVKENCLTLDQN